MKYPINDRFDLNYLKYIISHFDILIINWGHHM